MKLLKKIKEFCGSNHQKITCVYELEPLDKEYDKSKCVNQKIIYEYVPNPGYKGPDVYFLQDWESKKEKLKKMGELFINIMENCENEMDKISHEWLNETAGLIYEQVKKLDV